MVTWWPFSARARPGSIAAILTLLALRRKHKDYWIRGATTNLIGSQNKKWPQFAPWTRRRRGMKRNIQISETNCKTDTGPVFLFSLLHWYGCWSDDLCTQHLVRRVFRSEWKACLAAWGKMQVGSLTFVRTLQHTKGLLYFQENWHIYWWELCISTAFVRSASDCTRWPCLVIQECSTEKQFVPNFGREIR